MLKINNIHNNEIQQKSVNFKGCCDCDDKAQSHKTAFKVGLATAATAVSAAVVGGLLFKKGVLGNNVSKEIKTLKKSLQETIENQRKNESLKEFFDPEILQGYVDKTSKLGKKEQLEQLKDIHSTFNDSRRMSLEIGLRQPKELFNTSKLPKEVNDAISAKDEYIAIKEYVKYCDSLFSPAETKGKSVQDAIIDVVGKKSYVKPHNYDLSKEADRIGTVQYTGGSGYINVTVTSDNMIPSRLNSNTVTLFNGNEYNNMEVLRMRDKNNINSFSLGKGVTEDGKPFVSISYADEARVDASNTLCLLSPNKELTPAQNDLLSLQNAGDDFSIKTLKYATFGPHKTDFNVILSVVQDLASKVK